MVHVELFHGFYYALVHGDNTGVMLAGEEANLMAFGFMSILWALQLSVIIGSSRLLNPTFLSSFKIIFLNIYLEIGLQGLSNDEEEDVLCHFCVCMELHCDTLSFPLEQSFSLYVMLV